ncbi:hypothetical protein [Paractinoplanes rishiriensis]|uniref:Uncharacterized protein n=1 Tax=Paractinoplanes rishiriensis TaxID=1050105 RepID=A0A919MY62_9ACTN|nr:hypothetical protein [Actinoplanes rishiriensis]GIE99489.1 hypothetical protein Ari01nite_69540 [Actinoplanes rishiriensis]
MLFTHRRGKDSAAVYVTSQRERDNPIPERDETPFGRIDQAFLDLSEQLRPAAPRLPASLLGADHDTPMTPLAVRTQIKYRSDNSTRNPAGWIVDGHTVADRVWWYVAARARAERGDWLTVAAGMAVNGMRKLIPNYTPPRIRPLIHSDMIARLVELMAGEPIDYAEETPDTPERADTDDETGIQSETFDITGPYMFVRIMDRINYAAFRRTRRSTAPHTEEPEEEGTRHIEGSAAREHHSTPGRLHHGDPLIVLAGLVREGRLNRLDGSLLAHAYVGGWTQQEAFTAVRASLPAEVGNRTDQALRGRLERARTRVRTIYDDPADYRKPDQNNSNHNSAAQGANTEQDGTDDSTRPARQRPPPTPAPATKQHNAPARHRKDGGRGRISSPVQLAESSNACRSISRITPSIIDRTSCVHARSRSIRHAVCGAASNTTSTRPPRRNIRLHCGAWTRTTTPPRPRETQTAPADHIAVTPGASATTSGRPGTSFTDASISSGNGSLASPGGGSANRCTIRSANRTRGDPSTDGASGASSVRINSTASGSAGNPAATSGAARPWRRDASTTTA